jgi:hypothetical protein
MKQITEDYCSFEISKLLKEKGFDVPTFEFYEQEIWGVYEWDTCSPQFKHSQKYKPTNWNDEDDDSAFLFSCPSQSLALKWLREVHSIYITSEPDINDKHCFYPAIYTMTEESWDMQCFEELEELSFDKPEQAIDAALLYVLKNLI